MTDREMLLLKNQMLKQQNNLINHQSKEIERQAEHIAELEELLDLKDRLINEIFREHTAMGGRAVRIDHSRIVNDGSPIVLCYELINNIDCSVLRAVKG